MRSLLPTSRRPQPPPAQAPDLHTQLESLLDCVWKAEAEWRFDDRLELAHKRRHAGA